MKISNLIADAEGVVLLGAVALAGFFVYRGYKTAKAIGATGADLAAKVSQVYTSAATAAGNAVSRTENALQALVSPESVGAKLSPMNATPEQIRRDAVNVLDGLRTAKSIKDSNIITAPFSLWRDFTDWYRADTTGKNVRDSFYAKNPNGVFYD